eukprot:TRINITY_DN15858_c0_g1_i1.p1 TRINITY_DN15858_c0_g1~~TRINITY_DN15858_c0_g1_i1.p1  ORF type:complete len:224 (+),score=32.29 TRINITY_DN15858_c0_g1_i1:64-735(+)
MKKTKVEDYPLAGGENFTEEIEDTRSLIKSELNSQAFEINKVQTIEKAVAIRRYFRFSIVILVLIVVFAHYPIFNYFAFYKGGGPLAQGSSIEINTNNCNIIFGDTDNDVGDYFLGWNEYTPKPETPVTQPPGDSQYYYQLSGSFIKGNAVNQIATKDSLQINITNTMEIERCYVKFKSPPGTKFSSFKLNCEEECNLIQYTNLVTFETVSYTHLTLPTIYSV